MVIIEVTFYITTIGVRSRLLNSEKYTTMNYFCSKGLVHENACHN